MVDPGHDFEFIVDHKQRMQQREVKLTEGLHSFSLWAPDPHDRRYQLLRHREPDLRSRCEIAVEP